MKFSIRLLALVSLPAAALALGCSSNKTSQGYTADRGNAPVAPAHLTSTTGAPSQHPQGWSAPVWRGPIPAGGKTVGASTSMPTVTGPVAMTPTPPMSAPVRAQAPTSYGFNWAGSLKEAQDSARAQAKLIFIEAGREACGNCQFLKREVIPSSSVNSELGSMSVGYYDDVNLTPYSDAYNIVAANIQSAGTLPLCGWVTPDLKWVHGFWGRRDATKFLAEISTARSTYQRMANAARPATNVDLGRLPSIGSLPDAELADVSAELTDDKMIDVGPSIMTQKPVLATVAPAAPESIPATTPEPIAVVEPVDVPPAPEAPAPTPDTNAAPVFASISPQAMPALTNADPVAASAPSVEEASRAWVRDELKRAAAALASRQYAEARSILSGVREKAKGLPEAREVEKGEVAIYNLRKIEKAGVSAEADKFRAVALRDLKDTVWMSLFA